MSATKRSIRRTAIGLAVAAGIAIPAAAAEGDVTYSVEVGGQAASVAEDRDTKFQEFRDVPQGAILDGFSLRWLKSASPWSFEATGLNGLRLDERYDVRFGKAGLLDVETTWDRTPQFLSRDGTWLLAGSPGNFTLDSAFRQEIEDQAAAGTVDTFMPGVLASSARSQDLRTGRDRAATRVTLRLPRGWTLSAEGGREKRQGLGRISTGTYIRTSAAGFDREDFVIRGLEMPQPVDARRADVGVSASFRRSRGFFTLGWDASRFSNEVDTLLWDNPFEAPPSVSSASDRGRSARGALDLWPDNTFERIHATGALNLPGRTRLNATLAVARRQQDDPFLPFTRNEALFFPGPDGTLGTGDDVPGTDPSLLPAADLDGEIRTTRADLRVTSRVADRLTLRGVVRTYRHDDRSPTLILPGYAAFGESAYRDSIGQTLAGSPALFNEEGDFSRTVWSVGGAYRFGPKANLDLEYASTIWDYDIRQVEETREDAYRAVIRLQPSGWFNARLTWTEARRDFEGDYEVGLEPAGVRAFDVWERDRTRYGIDLDFLPADRWTFGMAYSNWEDEFPGSVTSVTPFPYGLNVAESESISATLGYAAPRFSLSVTAGHDTSGWVGLMVTKTSLTATNYVPANRWTRSQDDTVDWASVAIEAQLLPERLRLFADLAYSRYEGRLDTENPEPPEINSAVAYPFPDLGTDLFSGRLALRWVLTRNLDLEARYWYEPFRLEDYAWDDLQPYLQGVVQETGTSPTDIRATDVTRYLALDSRYSDYTANILSAVLRAHF